MRPGPRRALTDNDGYPFCTLRTAAWRPTTVGAQVHHGTHDRFSVSPEARERLRRLAADLHPSIGDELASLIEADSLAQHYLEVEQRARRAEDLVDELRRHLAAREYQLDELRRDRDVVPPPCSPSPLVPPYRDSRTLRERIEDAGGVFNA